MDRATLIAVMDNPIIDDNEVAAFNEALVRADCTTVKRVAMFAAQIGHECVGMRYYSEIWGPSAQQLTYQGRMGNNNPGDGYRYRGSGPLQITGKDNFRSLSQWAHSKGYVPTPTYFVDDPDNLRSIQYGFLGAVWYWTVARNMNGYADSGDIYGATVAVNGGTYGLDDRTARYRRALTFGDKLLPTTTTGGLTMAQINDIAAALSRIEDQLGPKLPDWGEGSSFGKDSAGRERTFRDGLIAELADIKSRISALEAKLGGK